ncbi:MAG: acetyltransferase [Proteobacteria bacterium]|nr:acetyltransferase [Pseudomonadota bacterium]MBU1638962.1 acetyltransferase [Pseudomonadota bacterium]
MKTEIILIGGGGHCRACIDVIEQQGTFAIAGIIDLAEQQDHKVLGYPVIGTDADILKFASEGYSFLITIGQIKSAERRRQLFNKLAAAGAMLPTIISPRAYVSPHAHIGPGTIIMHGALVNTGATIGNNCIINSLALIEHDARIDDHCHISTGAMVNGNAQIGNGSFVGSQAMVREGVEIGEQAIIGAGTTILANITAHSTIKA